MPRLHDPTGHYEGPNGCYISKRLLRQKKGFQEKGIFEDFQVPLNNRKNSNVRAFWAFGTWTERPLHGSPVKAPPICTNTDRLA